MNALQVLTYVTRVPGVAGAFVTTLANQVQASEMPVIFDEEMVAGMAADGMSALETLRAENEGFYELCIDFDLMTLLIRDINGDLLFVLVDAKDELASIRIAANVAAKRYKADSTEGKANLDASTGGGLSALTPSRTQKPVREKKDKKKKGGGSIWG